MQWLGFVFVYRRFLFQIWVGLTLGFLTTDFWGHHENFDFSSYTHPFATRTSRLEPPESWLPHSVSFDAKKFWEQELLGVKRPKEVCFATKSNYTLARDVGRKLFACSLSNNSSWQSNREFSSFSSPYRQISNANLLLSTLLPDLTRLWRVELTVRSVRILNRTSPPYNQIESF